MTYSKFDMRVFPVLIIYILLFLLSLFMTIKLIKKWRERKVISLFHLSLVYMAMATASFVLSLGILEAIFTGYFKEIYRFSLPFAYSSLIVWTIFLFIFISGMTNKYKKALIPIVLIGALIIIFLFLPTNWWGYSSEDYEGKVNTRFYSTGSLVIYSTIVYLSIFFICQKAKHKTDDRITRVGFSLLAYSMIMMLLWFVFMIIDTILVVFTNNYGYTIFVYIAWIFAFLFMIFSYISLIMPKWFIKMIEKK